MRGIWRGQLCKRYRVLGFQLAPGKHGYKDGTDADGPEMSGKQGLAPGLDIWYRWFQRHHDWDPPKEDDEDRDDGESPGRQSNDRLVEHLPRYDGAEVDEVGQVEKQVDDVGNVRLLCL